MTTVVQFQPSTTNAFQFQPTLDGDIYTCIVTWNLYGQRFYINVIGLDGTLIFTLALIGSLPAPDPGISLTAGYFTSTMVFRQQSQTFEINP